MKDGCFQPGAKAQYDARRHHAHVRCPHPFESLRPGASASSVYASCTQCDLKSCKVYCKMSYEPKAKAKGKARAMHMVIDASRREQVGACSGVCTRSSYEIDVAQREMRAAGVGARQQVFSLRGLTRTHHA